MNKSTEKFNVGKLSSVNFNVMIAGAACCGKSTFMQSFALPYARQDGPSAGRQLLGDSLDCSIHLEERTATRPFDIRGIIVEKHNEFIASRCKLMTAQEQNALDTRIHCLVYMFGPHRVLQADRDCLKAVAGIVPVVPVLAKADSLTVSEREQYLQEISELMTELDSGSDLQVNFRFIGHEDSFVAGTQTEASLARAQQTYSFANIFALVCSAAESGLREYPWGCSVSAYDERVSDFRRLQRLVFERGNIARLRDLTQQMTIALHQRTQQQNSRKRKRAPDESAVSGARPAEEGGKETGTATSQCVGDQAQRSAVPHRNMDPFLGSNQARCESERAGNRGGAVVCSGSGSGTSTSGGDLQAAQNPMHEVSGLTLWAHPEDAENKIEVVPQLTCKLRPHQKEGVQFLFECTMGLRGFEGEGCILADGMGLGKTLMSITLLWTLLNQGFSKAPGSSAVRKIVVVCPTSLVGYWEHEIRKWVGEHCPTFAVKTDPKKMIKTFLQHRGKGVLIVSYETQRLYSKLFEAAATAASDSSAADDQHRGPGVDTIFTDPGNRLLRTHSNNNVCDLLIGDEAHKLKNADSGLAKSLNLLPARKRILLLSEAPTPDHLTEFFNVVNFCNPMVLGTRADFKRRYERPILASREPDASDKQTAEAGRLQKELSTIVNEFILKRGNILNAQHLPPKLVQFVCCRMTPLQETLYNHLLSSKEIRHAREGKQLDTLGAIRQLINICSHPKLLLDTYNAKRASNEPVSEELVELVNLIHAHTAASNSGSISRGGTSDGADWVDSELSGKMGVLCRMMQTMRASKQGQCERIVVVSNYTQTLDLIQQVCVQSNWPVLRLDGSISANKRTRLVDDFNNPASGAFVFLLSSKAGGCGTNLVGGSRLVLFDSDLNPAWDKQAAARIWREGQKRRCFTYRFMSTGSIEEKIIQRQLSKEGLADIVDDKEQVNQFSSDELRDLFSLRHDTASDTHDTLRCKRCNSVKVREASKKGGKVSTFTPTQAEECVQFLDAFTQHLQREAAAHIVRQVKSGVAQQLPSTIMNPSSPEGIALPFAAEIAGLKETLRTGGFASLPVYSKAQTEVMQGIDNTLQQARMHKPALPPPPTAAQDGISTDGAADAAVQSEEDKAEAEMVALYKLLFPATFSIFAEFLNRWVEAVPAMTLLGKTAAKSARSSNLALVTGGAATSSAAGPGAGNSGEGDSAEADESFEGEFVEQEGCPDDTDFNRWSHHCGVASCDDELLSRALADDNTVSFVFGLEVNWSLLESREALLREENEIRK